MGIWKEVILPVLPFEDGAYVNKQTLSMAFNLLSLFRRHSHSYYTCLKPDICFARKYLLHINEIVLQLFEFHQTISQRLGKF